MFNPPKAFIRVKASFTPSWKAADLHLYTYMKNPFSWEALILPPQGLSNASAPGGEAGGTTSRPRRIPGRSLSGGLAKAGDDQRDLAPDAP